MKKILVVDDEMVNIELVTGILRRNGFLAESAQSGYEVIEILKKRSYDLILLDIIMEGMDGIETCKLVKRVAGEIPVIMVTGAADSVEVQHSFEAGAVDYIKKPIDEQELVARIRNTFKLKKSQSQLKHLYGHLREELAMASKIQSYMLPGKHVVEDKVVFSSCYTSSEEVGGDLFDIIKISDDRYFVYVADVSGHGVQAALLMSAVKSTIHILSERMDFGDGVSEFVNLLNKILCEEIFHKNYMTMIAGVIDLKKMTFDYFNAGHPYLLCIDVENETVEVGSSEGSVPLGWSIDAEYREEDQGQVKLNENKMLLLYTDGVIESENLEMKQLEVKGLVDIVSERRGCKDCLLLPYEIKESIFELGYDLTKDDSILLMFQMLPKEGKRLVVDTKRFYNNLSRKHKHSVITPLKMVGMLCKIYERKVFQWSKDEELAARVGVVLTEFLNNIFIHAYKRKNLPVIIEMEYSDSICLRFIDEGKSWDPKISCGLDACAFSNNYLYAESGRGTWIIQTIASEFKRRRIGELNETVIKIESGDHYDFKSEGSALLEDD